MSTQTPVLTATVNRDGNGQFSSWGLSGGTNCTSPSTCTVTVNNGNNANFTVNISDPNGPNSGPQQVTFAASPIFVSPTQKLEIKQKSIAGGGTTALTFTDHNYDQDTLNVVLKFNNAPPMDPIIQNGGGGPPGAAIGFLPNTITAFAIDLAIVLAIGVVIGLVIRRRSA